MAASACRMRECEIFMNAATRPMGMANGNPTHTSASEISQPTKTVGMELTMSCGSKKVLSGCTEFHACTAGCSSSQSTMPCTTLEASTSMAGLSGSCVVSPESRV